MDARTRFETRTVGGLPVVQAFLEELGFAKIVDEIVPWEGDVPLGTLAEILMCNRMLAPCRYFVSPNSLRHLQRRVIRGVYTAT